MKLELLLEDLGNLKFIDEKFFKFLKTIVYNNKKQVALPSGYGENVEIKIEKNINKVRLGTIVEDDEFAVGILKYQDTQLAMIKKYKADQYELVVDMDLLESRLNREEEEKLFDMELDDNLLYFKLSDNHLVANIISNNRIDKQLRILLDVVKLCVKDIDFEYALVDITRKELSNFRGTRKKVYFDKSTKIFPSRIPGSNELTFEKDSFYLNTAKNLLKMRLQNYKISNATNIDSINKLLEIVKDEGIKDIFKVKGFTYKLQTLSNFDVRSLKGEDDKKPYIVYELYKDEYVRKIEGTLTHFMEVHGDINNWPESVKRHWSVIKPLQYIKIEMKFRFGQIIPVNIVGSDNSF